jgi:hypothetical protein
MSRPSRQFVAVDDEGRQYTVIADHTSDSAGDSTGSIAGNAATQVLRTSNGMRLRRVSKGVYEIVQTWQTIRSSDPDAP